MRSLTLAIRRFFQELRHTDLKTRKRWRTLLSGVSMISIIALWALYSRVAFPSYDANAVTTETTASTTQILATTTPEATAPTPQSHAGNESIFDTLGKGLSVFGDDLQKGIGAVGDSVSGSFNNAMSRFKKTNSFEVQTPTSTPSETSTAPEPIPPTPLP